LPICEDYNQNSIYVLGKLKFSENEIDEVSEIELSNTLKLGNRKSISRIDLDFENY